MSKEVKLILIVAGISALMIYLYDKGILFSGSVVGPISGGGS